MSTWHFVLCELDTVALAGASISEVYNASERTLNLRLNATPVATFTISLDNPMAEEIKNRDGDVLLKVYQDTTLRFIGDCMSIEQTGQIHHIWKRDSLLTRAFSLGSDDQDVRSADDQTAILERGLYEEVVSGDVGNAEARQALAAANVQVRKTAQHTISFDRTFTGEPTMACTFSGPLQRLFKRLSGKATGGVSFLDVNRQAIPQTLLTSANAEKDTGIRLPTSPPTLEKVSFGPIQYKPTGEGYTELADLLWPAYVARDSFTAQTVTTALVGQSDSMGNVWGFFPAATDDFYYIEGNATGVITRQAVADPLTGSLRGRVEVSGALGPFTDISVGVNFSQNTTPTAASYYGVCARQSDASNFVLAFVASSYDLLQFYKFKAGTPTLIQQVALGTSVYPGAWYSIQLQILADGSYKVWWYDALGGIGTPKMTGTDAELHSTTGYVGLRSGGIGIYDATDEPLSQAGLQRRHYGSFFALDPVAPPTSMDFDLVPAEPTADTGQSGVVGAGVKIATLSLASTLGASKPEAIFESGTGKPSDPSYGTDYVVGDTVTARSVRANTTPFNAAVRVFGADISIDKEGKETTVPLLSPT